MKNGSYSKWEKQGPSIAINKKLHSTETSLIYISDRILTAIDQKKKNISVVLLDMSKAFDSVNHDILVKNYRICLP